MTIEFMEIWASGKGHPFGCIAYLQLRDGQWWICWLGRKGKPFKKKENACKWLARNGFVKTQIANYDKLCILQDWLDAPKCTTIPQIQIAREFDN